jgi:two-component system, LytTR family, sensor kinase
MPLWITSSVMYPMADHHQQSGSCRKRLELKTGVIVLLIATVLGFFFAAQIYFSAASIHREVSWWQALYWAFGDWYEWALLSPIIFWVCRRFPFDRLSWPKSLPVHLAVGILLSGFHAVLCALAAVLQGSVTGSSASFGEALNGLLANRTHFNLAVYALIVCAWHAWDYHRRYREREAQTEELTARLAQAQLETLRMQLNPHFLFNTLNAISSLMLKDVNAANKMLSRLGELLRLTLETRNQQEVPLKQELDFVRRYVEIEQIRFGDRLKVKMDIESATLEARVPNLILQPLVENAIRHAIEPLTNEGQIVLRATRDNGNLRLEVSDNGEGLKPQRIEAKETSDRAREHIGLNNTRQRLQKLYGEQQSFELVERPAQGVSANIRIPFRLVAVA